MNHYIVKCEQCHKVISQCRCYSKDKHISWIICENCKTHEKELTGKSLHYEVWKIYGYIEAIKHLPSMPDNYAPTIDVGQAMKLALNYKLSMVFLDDEKLWKVIGEYEIVMSKDLLFAICRTVVFDEKERRKK